MTPSTTNKPRSPRTQDEHDDEFLTNTASNYVLCPRSTADYRIEQRTFGYCLVANRAFAKGDGVFGESLEFCFRDVRTGDQLLLCGNYDGDDENQKAICLPLDQKVLMETHGVGLLQDDDDDDDQLPKEAWHLESPGMLMNHSCDPNVEITNWEEDGEGVAARDIAEGEELTCDYAFFDYEEAGTIFECQCGATNCRGKRIAFGLLTSDEKESFLKGAVSSAVKARHNHALGQGPQVIKVDPPPPLPRVPSTVPRLVTPGPSSAEADSIEIRPCPQPTIENDTVASALFATQDIQAGRCVYWFWAQPWPIFPQGKDLPLDLVAGLAVEDNDLPEGTVMAQALDPLLCASRDATTGAYQFTGIDLLLHHSCHPNIVYKPWQEDSNDNWRGAFACRDIKQGDMLTMDFNSRQWQRPTAPCLCGSHNCRGTVGGFAALDAAAQQELLALNWKRQPLLEDDLEDDRGEALAPFVRKQWKEEQQEASSKRA